MRVEVTLGNGNIRIYEAIKVEYNEDGHEFKVIFGITEDKTYRDSYTFTGNDIKMIRIDDEVFMIYSEDENAKDLQERFPFAKVYSS